ncbi:MAG: hypothetical protein PHC61_16040 [Chitinivibrionales bacterium]|nr:hypothetical protein [Chitinivibrionales bacterium]
MNTQSLREIWNRASWNYVQNFILFRTEGLQSQNPKVRDYLLRLAVKKEDQMKQVYDMKTPQQNSPGTVYTFYRCRDPWLHEMDLFDIYEFAWTLTQEEIAYYQSLLAHHPDEDIQSFSWEMLEMLQDFSNDVKVGYVTRATRNVPAETNRNFQEHSTVREREAVLA